MALQGVRTNKYRRLDAGARTTIDGLPVINTKGNIYYVDGTLGSNNNTGARPDDAFATIAKALSTVSPFDIVFVLPKKMAATDTDPGSYAEALTITTPQISLIGLPQNDRTQGGLPQISKGSGTAPIINVKAPGVEIANLGINGSGSTGGGIKLTDDGGATAASFGYAIHHCHFKNCKGSNALDASTGGAVQLSGAPWQGWIYSNRFYKNVGDIVLLSTSNAVPQDTIIEDNVFSGPAASVDCSLYLAGGSGMVNVVVRGNYFTDFPALSSGVNVKHVVMTGCTGLFADNRLAGNAKTYDADDGTGGLIPTTVFIVNNYQESSVSGGGAVGLINRDSA